MEALRIRVSLEDNGDEIALRQESKSTGDMKPFCVSFTRRGIHAWQYLSLADLTSIRDWCDRVLTVAKADEKEAA